MQNDNVKEKNCNSRSPMMDLLNNQTIHIEKNYLLHYHVGDKLEHFEVRFLGIPMVTLSIIVTSFIGLSLADAESIKISFGIKLTFAIFSLIVTILSSLITFLQLKDKALLHHQAADNYYDLLAHCRAFIADPEFYDMPVEKLRTQEQSILEQLHKLQRNSPPIPAWAYDRVERLISSYRRVSNTVGKK